MKKPNVIIINTIILFNFLNLNGSLHLALFIYVVYIC